MKGRGFRNISYAACLICALCIPFILYFIKEQKNELNTDIYTDGVFDDERYPVNKMSIDEVAKLVQYEAEAVAKPSVLEYECAASLSAMEYVHSNISGYTSKIVRNLDEYAEFEGTASEKAQYFSYGFCQSKALVMMEILNRLGIENREISFWKIDGKSYSHACLEAKWDNEWHFFDPTYGLYFGKDVNHVLSWRDIEKLPPEEAYELMVISQASLANSITEFRGGITIIL